MKKISGLLLSMLLALTVVAGAAFAAEETGSATEATEAATEATEAATEATEAATEATEATEAAAEVSMEDLLGDSEGISVEVPLSPEGEVIMDDYSIIEIPSNQVNVQDYEIDTMIDSILQQSSATEEITEGTIEEGDTVVMDFVGVLDGEDEPFEGGSAEGVTATIGSGTFIPGFEDQIIGHKIGETFDIHVTFPAEYREELAGKDATFTITVHNKTVTTVPELTDEFVKEFAAANLDTELQSVDELREYIRDYLYRNYMMNAIMNQLKGKVTVVSYPEELFQTMKDYSLSTLSDYVTLYAMQGMGDYTEDMLAKISGYATAEDYSNDQAKTYLDTILLADEIAQDLGTEVTDEEFEEYLTLVLQQNGLDESYTQEEMKEIYGDGWVTINRYNLLIDKELQELMDRTVVVESAMTYYEFLTADVDSEIMVDMYVQDTQAWNDGKISVYGADHDGGFFVNEMACSEEDAAKLVPGTKIRVTGYKAEWAGEVGIADAAFIFSEDADDTYIQEPVDVTELLGTSQLVNYMNQFTSFKGMTVEPSVGADGNESAFLYNRDGSGAQGDDVYFNVSYNGTTYTFMIESSLRGADTDVYKAAEALNIGDVLDMEGFLYWYEGANPHITSITVK